MSRRPTEPSATIDRRQFLVQAGRASGFLTAATIMQACSSPSSSSGSSGTLLPAANGTVSGGVVSVTVAAGSALDSVGGMALIQTASNGTFLATRTAQTTFSVLTATCTHEGCTVTGSSGSTFVCPCHGSRYSTSGGVVNGPATRALQTFNSQFANGVLTFTL
jgi:cytochrome b6-f complex iron-sulfur subunit